MCGEIRVHCISRSLFKISDSKSHFSLSTQTGERERERERAQSTILHAFLTHPKSKCVGGNIYPSLESMAAPKVVSPGLHPQLVKLLEADTYQYSSKGRPHSISYYYFFTRAAFRHLGCLKTLCFFSFLFIIAWGFFSQNSPYSTAAWEKAVLQSAQRQEGGQLTVLVTGAAGFVGSHVALALKKRGDGVVGLDNFNHYYPVELKRARAANLNQAGIFIAEGDLNDQQLLAKLFDLVHFSHVLHLAAQAGVRYAVKNPLAYVHSNVGGFVTLLEQCKNTNPQPAIVYASSSSVYGLNSKVPFSEDDRTDHPASLYAATKKADEVLAHTYNHIYGLSITALRFFTVYGPWGRPDMAYFSFTRNIVEGKPITIFQGPHGEELARDFTFIDDIVKGCVASLDTALPSTGSGGHKRRKAQFRIFNLGNTQPVKVGDFVSILEKHLKKKAIRKIIPMPSTGDVMFTHANVTRAKKVLGYNPTTDLNTGLQIFVKWYKAYYKEGAGHGDMLKGYKPY